MKETGYSHWNSPNTDATNESGFTALPGGYRMFTGGFATLGNVAYFWSSSESGASNAWYRYLDYDYKGLSRYFNARSDGFSVRCLKN